MAEITEVTEIWVWTVWEETTVDAEDTAGSDDQAAPGDDAVATADTGVTSETAATSDNAVTTAAGPETGNQTGTDRAAEAAPPIAGYAVEASDGHIGTVDEVSYDAGTGAIVVDTGHWIFGKKRMVPAGMLAKIDNESRVVTLSCTKAAVRAAPDHDPARSDEAAHRGEVGEHYAAQREAGSGSGSG